ncbi:hypothetical protein EV363DRAFT_1296693 [Boletus edulis]|nr:hypothetical protein EV363DRAFT_1296693 [Boletus edulis]
MFVKSFATRFSQLSRLPYFSLIDQIVVDPMHNLFLGLIKTHFYQIWVQSKILQPNHELRVLHQMLPEFILPGTCGKLPTDISMPSGGQEVEFIPQLWAILSDHIKTITQLEAEKVANVERKTVDTEALKKVKAQGKEAVAAEKAHITREKSEAADRKKQRSCGLKKQRSISNPEVEESCPTSESTDEEVKFTLHPDDPANFLKLCSALWILLKYSLTDDNINIADDLLREYCTELIMLYGTSPLKPNHHFATHTASFVQNFGPLHNFWTFLFEQLNKILNCLTFSLLRLPKELLANQAASPVVPDYPDVPGLRRIGGYEHRDVPVSTSEEDLNTDCPQSGLAKRRKIRKKFATATERVQTVVKCQPEDWEELQEEMGAWVKEFRSAMDKWDTVRREAITLFINMDLDDDVAAVIVQAERVQAEWVAQQKVLPMTQEASAPGTSQMSKVEVKEGAKDLVPEPEKTGASSGASLVSSSLKWGRSDKSDDEEEGMSTQCKRTIAAELAMPRPPPVVKACDSCKRAGVAEACSKGTGIACQHCNRLKAKCSWVAGRHAPRRKTTVVVVLEGTKEVRPVRATAKAGPSKRADSPIILNTNDDIEEDETPVKSKGKGKAPAKKPTGQTPVQKQRDVLARQLNLLHSRMYQIRANLKALEVEQDKVLAEVSDVVGELEELDI